MSQRVSAKLGLRPASPLKLVIIDPDSIYRTGLQVVLSQNPEQLQVVAEAENITTALEVLSERTSNASNVETQGVDLVLLGSIDFSQFSQLWQLQSSLLKTEYPNLPVLLLTFPLEPTQMIAVKASGVDGYCPKGIAYAQLVTAIATVAAGREYWVESSLWLGDKVDSSDLEIPSNIQILKFSEAKTDTATPVRSTRTQSKDKRDFPPNPKFKIQNSLARLRHRLRISGIQQIDTSLAEVTAQLQPGLPLLEQAILAGQKRELLASRWLVNQLLASPEDSFIERAGELRGRGVEEQRGKGRKERGREGEGESGRISPPHPLTPSPPPLLATSHQPLATLHSSLFASIREKLEFSLENLTRVPLEIDILREGKKRELLALILQKIDDILIDLRFSQVKSSQLVEMDDTILRDLWQAATTDFFGKYSTLTLGDRSLEIVNILLQDAVIVQTAILSKIPLVAEVFSYLLFENELVIYNNSFRADSPEAKERAELIIQNLLIGVANAVVQPLLNNFANVEVIKENYYDKRLISTREVERFRNELSWKYRLENYIGEPKKIFESRYEMFLFVSRGIAKTSIYAPRNQELAKLTGIPLAVTLALELRDAIAPRLRSVIEFLGNGVVYVLTQVVGRAIGLIGRGILQGLGGSLPESKNKKL